MDYKTLKTTVQKLVRDHDRQSSTKRADCIELNQAARDAIEIASPADLGDSLYAKVQTEGAIAAFPKFLGLRVVKWDASELRLDYEGRDRPLPPSLG